MNLKKFILIGAFFFIFLNYAGFVIADCAFCNVGVCNGVCESGEDLNWCDDCTTAACGDTTCDPGKGEDYTTCPGDCPPPCTDDCYSGQTSCDDSNLRTCGNYDIDPCLDWQITSCDDSNPSTTDSCSGGQCIHSDTCPGAHDSWSGSQCVCDSGYANCDGNTANGCEITLGTTSNCLSCGDSCNDGLSCTTDSCTAGCTHINTCGTGNCIPPAPGTCTQCGTASDCTSPPTCYQLPATCAGGSCQYQTAPSITQCGTDTLCSYTGCSGICGRTGTLTDYHCNGAGSCQGYTTTCSPLTCSAGTSCSAGSCSPASETCNNIDDDCDGQTDENLGTTTCGVGICLHTVQNCIGGFPNTCNPYQGATTETCDTLDNDCDGQVDEGCSCANGDTRTGTCGLGPCSRSVQQTCSGGIWAPACVPGSPATETCNNIDDDCDGIADDGLSRQQTCGVGICYNIISQMCSVGSWLPSCVPGPSTTEACNGLDDDCDGAADDGFNLQTDPNNCGSCNRVCSFSHAAAACSAGTCAMASCNAGYVNLNSLISDGCECQQTQSAETTCNDGIDNDCDNNIDCADTDCSAASSCICTGTAQRLCPNQNGVCKNSKETCTNNQWPGCGYTFTPSYETDEKTCDNLDNDCDGTVDEGCDKDLDTYCDSSMKCAGTYFKCSNGRCLDCDDNNKDINPGKTETCDAYDNNCDGNVNENNACNCNVADVLKSTGTVEIIHPTDGGNYYMGDIITFYAREDEGSTIEGYNWELGDGEKNEFQQFNHLYRNKGDYQVKLTYYARSSRYNERVCDKVLTMNIHVLQCQKNEDCLNGEACKSGVCTKADVLTAEQTLTISINSPTNQVYSQKIVPLTIAASKPSACSYSLNDKDFVAISENTRTIEGKEGINTLKVKCAETIASSQFTVKLQTQPTSIIDDVSNDLKQKESTGILSDLKDKGVEMKTTADQARELISEVTDLGVFEITKSRQVSGLKSLIMLSIRNLLPITIENADLEITIPKSVANSASEIQSPNKFTILQDDPVISFNIQNITKDYVLLFEVNKVVDEALLKEIGVKPSENLNSLLKKQQDTANAVRISKEFEEYQKDGETYTKIKTKINPKKGLKGMSVIEKIPKCLAKQIDYLNIDERYKANLKVLNADPLIMWQFEEITSEKYFEYDVKGVLSEDCRKQIRSMGIADQLGIDIESRDYFKIILPLLIIPLLGVIVVRLHRFSDIMKKKEEDEKGKPAEKPRAKVAEKKEEQKPRMEAKDEDEGKFLQKEIDEAEKEFKREMK